MSPRTAGTLPEVQPILLTLRREPFDDPAWVFEPKSTATVACSTSPEKAAGFGLSGGTSQKRFQELCHSRKFD